jgi:predicted 2-oxoglutarate/Fe(II)-dependent dioxygenase YbiX
MALLVNNLFPGEITPNAVVGGCIEIFENVWPNHKETISLVERECSRPDSGAYWSRAETMNLGPFQNHRTNQLLEVSHLANVSNNKLLQNIHNQMNLLLLAGTNSYAQRFGINELLYHESYNLLRYSEGQEYQAHYDGGTSIGRAISAIIYLNSDYEGGHLEFVNFNVKIKPEPGMMILFPSNYAYRHVAHPVTKGTKYALVTWIKDRLMNPIP